MQPPPDHGPGTVSSPPDEDRGPFDPGVETRDLRRDRRDGPPDVELGAHPFDPGEGVGYNDRRARPPGLARPTAKLAAVAAAIVLEGAGAHGAAARKREQGLVDGLDLPPRESEQRVRRAEFGAERAELLAALDDLSSWYRDLVVVENGAESAVVNADLLSELREDAAGPAASRADEAAAVVRQAWREAEEFNLNASLFLEALFVQLRRAFV